MGLKFAREKSRLAQKRPHNFCATLLIDFAKPQTYDAS